MTSPTALRKLLLKSAAGGLLGLGFGCVLTTGGAGTDECDCIACNSYIENGDENGDGKSGECICEPGYDWAEPNNPNNFNCDLQPPKPGTSDCVESYHVLSGDTCYCIQGYDWCNPNDDDDLSCCQTGGGSGDDGSGPGDDDGSDTDPTVGDDTMGDDTGGPVCSEDPPAGNGNEPPAEACTPETAGAAFFCSNSLEEGPAGSRYWECEESGWVEHADVLETDCVDFQGFQFALGCVDDGTDILILCGDGPGTDCSGAECDACADDDQLNFCGDGKLQSASCSTFCQETGIDGITFDTGFCAVDADIGPTCSCCDAGEEGCPG